jgi:hypothetical protein
MTMLGRLKRAALPAAAAVIIIAALFYRLASCANQPGGNAGVAGSPTAGSPTVSVPPSPTGSRGPDISYTDEDIRSVFTALGFEVRTIRDAGPTAAAVEYYYPKCSGQVPSRFAWVDRETGAYTVVSGGLLTDRVEIFSDSLMVLTTGWDLTGNKQNFPEVFISSYLTGDVSPLALRARSSLQPYYMPVDRSFTVGDDNSALLDSLVIDFDAVSAGFSSPDEATPLAGIPKTGVVCSGGYCHITFYNTALSPGFKAPKAGAGDGLRTFVSVTSDGMNTQLTLKLGERARRYNIASDVSPDDGRPYAVFSFRPEEGVSYPPGW